MKRLVILRHGYDSTEFSVNDAARVYLAAKQLASFGEKTVFFSSPLSRATEFAEKCIIAGRYDNLQSEEWKASLKGSGYEQLNVVSSLRDGAGIASFFEELLNIFKLTQKCDVDCVVLITHTGQAISFLGKMLRVYEGAFWEFSSWNILPDISKLGTDYYAGEYRSQADLERLKSLRGSIYGYNANNEFISEQELASFNECYEFVGILVEKGLSNLTDEEGAFIDKFNEMDSQLTEAIQERYKKALQEAENNVVSLKEEYRNSSKIWKETYKEFSFAGGEDCAVNLSSLLQERGIISLSDAFEFLDDHLAKQH